MIKLFARLGFVALVATITLLGCSKNGDSPTAPTTELDHQPRFRGLDVPTCGEETYLTGLSSLLPVWRDSIQAWLPSATLNETPAWTGGSVSDYLGVLVPVLQQWQSAVNTAAGSELLAAVPDFNAASDTPQVYLSALSAVLASWETSAETARGADFLPTLPTFVPDTFAPMIVCPSDTTFGCADSAGVLLDFEVVAVDDCDPAPVIVCEPPSGSTFHTGTTTVTCTATDASGNVSSCSFNVTVDAAAELDIADAAASPSRLWPPNHKMVDISFDLNLENDCDLPVTVTVIEVTSNEPVNGIGDGNTEPDWVIGEDGHLQLRAERSGTGDGRIYTIRLRVESESGDADETTVQVVVPHDQGHGVTQNVEP